MSSKLAEIVRNKKAEVLARMAHCPASVLKSSIVRADGSFLKALGAEGTNLICELKPKSPSAGVLKAEFNLSDILPHYQSCAAAVSVLTDHKYFGGSLELLAEVAARTALPTLCKDFFIDPYQCLEARQAGAQAVLLIVKILSDDLLQELHKTAIEMGMTAVVEVQNQSELNRTLALNPQVFLINNRNLDTFEISLATTSALAPNIPNDVITISASGFCTRAEIVSMLPFCHNFLIGSSLMTATDLRAKLHELKGSALEGRQLKRPDLRNE
jgi:indole-3-glycerol phosphate synthase/phosphoribosylanthranilate isomerase